MPTRMVPKVNAAVALVAEAADEQVHDGREREAHAQQDGIGAEKGDGQAGGSRRPPPSAPWTSRRPRGWSSVSRARRPARARKRKRDREEGAPDEHLAGMARQAIVSVAFCGQEPVVSSRRRGAGLEPGLALRSAVSRRESGVAVRSGMEVIGGSTAARLDTLKFAPEADAAAGGAPRTICVGIDRGPASMEAMFAQRKPLRLSQVASMTAAMACHCSQPSIRLSSPDGHGGAYHPHRADRRGEHAG